MVENAPLVLIDQASFIFKQCPFVLNLLYDKIRG